MSVAGAAGIRGDYVEARTADVFTGPCFSNAEVFIYGKQAVMAWKVDEGSYRGVDLGGLSVAAAIQGMDLEDQAGIDAAVAHWPEVRTGLAGSAVLLRETRDQLDEALAHRREYEAAMQQIDGLSEELAATLEGIDGGVMGGVVVEKDRREPGAEAETVRDDVRLLRFRTRRRELVVVPDARFILIVFIDTPAAA